MPPKVSDAYKEKKRLFLIESAMHCFAEKGFQSTTIDDIASHAGSSKGAIYNYFKSKEEIYLDVMEERDRHFFTSMQERFVPIKDATGKIRYLLQLFREARLGQEERNLIRVQLEFWLYCSRQAELTIAMQERYETFLHFLEEILEEGKRNGEFREEVDVRIAASLFWALRDGTGNHFLIIGEEKRTYHKIWLELEDMLFRYLMN